MNYQWLAVCVNILAKSDIERISQNRFTYLGHWRGLGKVPGNEEYFRVFGVPTWRISTLRVVKHLILDVSVIIDLWLGVGSAEVTESLFDFAAEGEARLWVSASSISRLDFGAKRAFQQRGIAPEEVGPQLARLMEDLFCVAGVLTNHGFEQMDIYRAASDFEDAQIAASARNLQGVPVCVVSEDAGFDTLGEVLVKTPSDALTWMHREVADESPGTIPFIDLATQQALNRPSIEKGIERVLRHGKYIMGPEIQELEKKLADYVGVKHAIAVASGTDSLEIVLRALDIGPGDEVITVPFTWISTAEVIAQVGARPVFIDIDPAFYNMNVDLLEAAITPRTKAILPVSLFGQMPDYDRINAIAAKFNLPVIEDAAQSFGATQRGRRSCGVTMVASTSFFPAKPFGCYGDGGALFTNDDELATRMRAIRTHGGLERHHHPYIGMNGRFDTIQAAILLAKLEHFDWEVQRRQEVGARYTELLNADCSSLPSIPSITPPQIAEGNTCVYAQYTIRAANRDALAAHLKQQGIPTAVYYPKCLHEQPAFSFCGYVWGDFPVAEKASREVLSLPMHPFLNQADQDRVIAALRSALGL